MGATAIVLRKIQRNGHAHKATKAAFSDPIGKNKVSLYLFLDCWALSRALVLLHQRNIDGDEHLRHTMSSRNEDKQPDRQKFDE